MIIFQLIFHVQTLLRYVSPVNHPNSHVRRTYNHISRFDYTTACVPRNQNQPIKIKNAWIFDEEEEERKKKRMIMIDRYSLEADGCINESDISFYRYVYCALLNVESEGPICFDLNKNMNCLFFVYPTVVDLDI